MSEISKRFEEEHKKLFSQQMTLEDHYKRLKKFDSEDEAAAVKIQALYRGSSVRKQQKIEREAEAQVPPSQKKEWDSSLKLVTPIGQAATKKVEVDTTAKRTGGGFVPIDEQEAATKIQAVYKGTIVRRNTRSQLHSKGKSDSSEHKGGTLFPESILNALPAAFGATPAQKDLKLKIALVAIVVLILAIFFMRGGGAGAGKKVVEKAAAAAAAAAKKVKAGKK